MADLTDSVFARVCREVSDEVKSPKVRKVHKGDSCRFVVFREMMSAEAIVRGNKKTLKMCEIDPIERPVVLQLFGGEPEVIVKAARKILERTLFDFPSRELRVAQGINAIPDGIDINMGCPVPKIAGKGRAGAYLMKDHTRAVEIIKAFKKANLGLPISVKTRLGWSKKTEILDFASKLEQAGVDAITIHGRTKKQGYGGQADWEMIGRVKKILNIPVIANGDIKDSEDIERCLEITGADGVMIGRAALGNPWIFSYKVPPPCRWRSGGGLSSDETSPLAPLPRGEGNFDEIVRVVMRHAELHQEKYGSLVSFRKHLLCYFKGFENVKELRLKLVKVSDVNELRQILKSP
jgi:nifR3 family TIM-barrel protein